MGDKTPGAPLGKTPEQAKIAIAQFEQEHMAILSDPSQRGTAAYDALKAQHDALYAEAYPDRDESTAPIDVGVGDLSKLRG